MLVCSKIKLESISNLPLKIGLRHIFFHIKWIKSSGQPISLRLYTVDNEEEEEQQQQEQEEQEQEQQEEEQEEEEQEEEEEETDVGYEWGDDDEED